MGQADNGLFCSTFMHEIEHVTPQLHTPAHGENKKPAYRAGRDGNMVALTVAHRIDNPEFRTAYTLLVLITHSPLDAQSDRPAPTGARI